MQEAGDTVIQNCTLCQPMLAGRVPEVRMVSLCERLLAAHHANRGTLPRRKSSQLRFASPTRSGCAPLNR